MVREVEQRSAAAIGEPVTLSIWARADVQVTSERYAPLGEARAADDVAPLMPSGTSP